MEQPHTKTIVHVIDSLKVGGAQTHLVTMLREAIRVNPAQHRVLSLFDDGPIGDQIREMGIPVDVLELGPLLKKRRYTSAATMVADQFREHPPDIVEAHLTYSRLLGLYAAWRVGVPQRIAFEHGDLYLNSWKFRMAHFVGQRLAHHIIVVSEALQSWAKETYKLSGGRSVVIHNCVDIERFRSMGERAGLHLDFPDKATRFVTVGTLGRGVNKRVDVLIQSVAKARRDGADVVLVVCGDGEQRNELEALALSLDVTPFIQFLGMRSDIPAILAASDVFCLGTAFDPFPIAGLEALTMGLPLVVPDAGGMVEAIRDGETGFVYPVLDYNALAKILCWFHAHPQERVSMGITARHSADERFSVGAYMERLFALYGLQVHEVYMGDS